MDILELFSIHGYFPAEIVPCFNTLKLRNIIQYLKDEDLSKKRKDPSKGINYSIPRYKRFRRLLSISNPLDQLNLFKTLAIYWDDLESFFNKSKLSLSSPKIDVNKKRAITRLYDFSQINTENILRSKYSRIILKTDISRYYSTIYSHSIPWALHSKVNSKNNKNNKQLFGNLIDDGLRKLQDGQSMGIPTGPDSSFAIAEIIGSAIDVELEKKINNLKGSRYIDDFNLYFSSIGEAEYAYDILHKILKEFELEINPGKTEIVDLPQEFEKEWVRYLRTFPFRKRNTQANDIVSFFNIVFDFHKKFPEDPVLKYSIQIVRKIYIHKENWPLFESLILQSIIIDPGILQIASKILKSYSDKKYKLDEDKISEVLSEMIIYHCTFNYNFEISWILWIVKSLRIKISGEAIKSLETINDPIIALMIFDLINCKLIPDGFDISNWGKYMNLENLYTDFWILSYEANIKKWFKFGNRKNYLEKDSFFSILKESRVEFYDTNIEEHADDIQENQNQFSYETY